MPKGKKKPKGKEKAKAQTRFLTKLLIGFACASVVLLVSLVAVVAASYMLPSAPWANAARDALCVANLAFAFLDLAVSAYTLGYYDALRTLEEDGKEEEG